MQLLDRYLTAIKFWLPNKQRDDIVAELAANLQSEIDDRGAELGRPLTEDEVATLLKQHGAPVVVASRYQQEQRTVSFGRQLISPIVFPFYLTAIKVTLVLLLIPGVVPAVILGAQAHGNPFAQLGHALTRMAWLALPALLVVTLVFALGDFLMRRFRLLEKTDWDPRTLPSSARQANQVRRSSSVAGIVVNSLFILWWWKYGSIPYLVVTNSGAQIHFAPIVTSLYVPVLIIAFINLAQHLINLAEPDWRWLPSATGAITSFIGLIVLFPLLGRSPLISINEISGLPLNAREAAEIDRIVAHCVNSLWLGILIVGSIFVWRLAWMLWQSRRRHPSGAARNGMAHV